MKKFILLILTAIISFGYINESRAGNTYIYDENGNLIKMEFGTSYYKYSYENGNKTKAEKYRCSSGTCTKSGEDVYTYTDGNMTKKEHYVNCSSGTCTTKGSETAYTYTDGNMTKEENYSNCSSGTCTKSGEHRYTYTDGNMTKMENYSNCSSGTCTKKFSENVYTYEFDKYGNIIKQYSNGNLSESHEYPDEYYNMKCTKAGDCTSCVGSKVLQGKACVAECGASFRLNDGECDRIRYTPAEAAKVLTDDNNNSVTITFKK